MDLRFRPLEDGDLPLLHRWLNEPGVARWWEGRDVSREAVQRDFGSGHGTFFEHWLALRGDRPLGWLQCYCAWDAVDGEAFHWRKLIDLSSTGAIDYLVGDPSQRGRGAGAAMIRGFVREVVLGRHPEWQRAAAGPFEANAPSVRALAKAGFRRVATLADRDGPCALMVLEREELEKRASP